VKKITIAKRTKKKIWILKEIIHKLKNTSMTFNELKNFYINNQLQDEVIRETNQKVIKWVFSFKPKTVFEFGCNNGKNLELLESIDPTIKVYGIDLSAKTLKHKNTEVGDEETLKKMKSESFDVVFTGSVLNHIPQNDVTKIIDNLKRIAKTCLISCEHCHESSPRWFIHDYEKFGYKKVDTAKAFDRLYDIMVLEK